MQYKEYIGNMKVSLDNLLIEHKAQPVGWGYIDVICHRLQIESMIDQVIANGFIISTISWWEYIENGKVKPLIGMGGPVSLFYKGWYAEINEYDNIYKGKVDILKSENNQMKTNQVGIYEMIKNKKTKFFGGNSLAFDKDECLTPAIWIEVPEDWINPYTRNDKLGLLPEYQKVMDTNRKGLYA